jgi:hypothetical protein
MYTKIGRTGGQVTWNVKLGDSMVAVSGKWFGGETGSPVYVTVQFADGETIERRGTMNVERTLRSGPGERLTEPVFFASVSSLGGDIVGSARGIKPAVEDYASKVAQELVAQRRKAVNVAETIATIEPGTRVSVDVSGERFTATYLKSEYSGMPAQRKAVFDARNEDIDAQPPFRNHCGDGLHRVPIGTITGVEIVAPAAKTDAERALDDHLTVAGMLLDGREFEKLAEHLSKLALDARSLALLGPEGARGIPVDAGYDAPEGAGHSVEADRG